jgi:predicted ATP-grasp superfamily ATP-dependent carboligase
MVVKAIVIPANALSEPATYTAAVAELVEKERADVVIPVTDRASRALLGQEAALGCHVAGPSAAAYRRASDKELLLSVAAATGIRVPRQHALRTRGETLPQECWLQQAVVVKAARSVVVANGRSISTSVRFAANPKELEAALASFPAEVYPLLVQERTIGDGVGVFLLRLGAQTRLSFGHRRVREKPPAGGVSTYRESIVPPPELLAKCERLLDALDYDGPAMVEFKRDSATGEFVLMEINARLWGSLQLAIDAGVDFPSAMVAHALGLPLPPMAPFRAGSRSVWELGELDHALALWRRSRDELHGPPGLAVGLGAAVRALADHRWSDRLEVFRWSDPVPFLAEVTRWLRRR